MRKSHLVIVLVILSITSIFIGVSELSIFHLLELRDEKLQILLISRIPRLVSILVAGISVSITGLIMQQITKNKFVSPTTAATVDSAKLGILVALMMFTGATTIQKMIISFAFSLMGTFIFMKLLKKIKYKDAIFVPLVGIMFGNIIDSITTFFAYKYDLVQNISAWLDGDFSRVIKGRYELLYISIPLVIIAYLYANKFTIVGMGEDFSTNLGMNYEKIVNIGICIVALVSSVVVITVGKIPFLGIVVPNIVTLYLGDDTKKNIPYIALLGAIFLLACDILGRIIIYPYEVSIGLTVGIIGSVIFLYLISRREVYGN